MIRQHYIKTPYKKKLKRNTKFIHKNFTFFFYEHDRYAAQLSKTNLLTTYRLTINTTIGSQSPTNAKVLTDAALYLEGKTSSPRRKVYLSKCSCTLRLVLCFLSGLLFLTRVAIAKTLHSPIIQDIYFLNVLLPFAPRFSNFYRIASWRVRRCVSGLCTSLARLCALVILYGNLYSSLSYLRNISTFAYL